ncbi:hypothetical protein WJ438_33995 [Streptomyces sp. GD-15H]|uniref:hypothetical protein n=1 Tax=Streptomyces sp. GD-15H TaxID=3129112 RepID=UPI0032544B6F
MSSVIRRAVRRLGAVALAAALLGGAQSAHGSTTATAEAAAASAPVSAPADVLDLVLTHEGLTLPITGHRPGWLTFRATTEDASGHYLSILKLADGVTADDVSALMGKVTSSDPAVAVPAVNRLYSDVEFNGGASVQAGKPVSVSVNLDPGTYHVVESSASWTSGRPAYYAQTLEIAGDRLNSRPPAHDNVLLAVPHGDKPAFIAPRHADTDSAYLVVNLTATPQEVIFRPVTAGTTDADIQAYYDADKAGTPLPSPFTGRAGGMLPISPGKTAVLRFENTVPGEYAVSSFTRDLATAERHAYNGMHRVITQD